MFDGGLFNEYAMATSMTSSSMPRATNEIRSQFATYCCIPLANISRMTVSTEMSGNRDQFFRNLIKAKAESLGLKLQLEKKQYRDSGPWAHPAEEGRMNLMERIQKLDLHAEI
jgi:hypothetical protein